MSYFMFARLRRNFLIACKCVSLLYFFYVSVDVVINEQRDPDLFITHVSVRVCKHISSTCVYCIFEYFIRIWCLCVVRIVPVIVSGSWYNATWQSCKWSPLWWHTVHLLPHLPFVMSLHPLAFPPISAISDCHIPFFSSSSQPSSYPAQLCHPSLTDPAYFISPSLSTHF